MMKMMMKFEICCLLITVMFYHVAASDDYVKEVQARCHKTKKPYSCTKYRVLRYVEKYATRDFNLTGGDSTLHVVSMPAGEADNSTGLFEESRQFPDDSEVDKLIKFFQRQIEEFLNRHGLVIQLPEGARLMEGKLVESRRKKKAAQFLIPLLILFKLFKIKVLVSLVLAGVFFIKKTILAAALILPSVVLSIKNHCKQGSSQYHVVPYHVGDEHEHGADTSGYGFSGYGGSSQDEGNYYHYGNTDATVEGGLKRLPIINVMLRKLTLGFLLLQLFYNRFIKK